MTATSALAFGLTAAARPWNGELAAAVEALGYVELWANDTSSGSGLDTLADAAAATERLRLAVGVLGLTEHRPAEIVERISALGLPRRRLVVGLGTGAGRSRAAVTAGVAELRQLAPDLTVAIAAVGPRMAALGGAIADVVLLNWAGARLSAERRELIRVAAEEAGRRAPRVAAYVRVAVGPGAEERLLAEQHRYLGYGGSYRSVITEQLAGADGPLGVACAEPGGVPAALADYLDALDTVVVRALPAEDTLAAWSAVAAAATLRA